MTSAILEKLTGEERSLVASAVNAFARRADGLVATATNLDGDVVTDARARKAIRAALAAIESGEIEVADDVTAATARIARKLS